MTSTVLTSWALLVWETLKNQGIDPRPVFNEAGLDPSKLGDGNARYKVEKMNRLWALTEEATGNPSIGIDIGNQWHVTTFHALGYAWLASDSFGDAVNRMARYARLVNNAIHTRLDKDGPFYRFYYHAEQARHLQHPVSHDAALSALLKMCRMLLGDSFHPVEVRAERPLAAIRPVLESHFQCPFQFDCEENCWILDRYDAERRLPSANPELVRINEALAVKYLAHIDKNDIVNQVRQKITEQLPAGKISEQGIAQSLNLSTRSLQRHLSGEQQSFLTLLNEIRQQLAVTYISNSTLSLNEISYLLGFSEPASFTRAFKRWHGDTPSQFRRKLKSQPASHPSLAQTSHRQTA